jgi:hypothetical protein
MCESYFCNCEQHYSYCFALPLLVFAVTAAGTGHQLEKVDRAFIMGEFEALRTLLDVMRCTCSTCSTTATVLCCYIAVSANNLGIALVKLFDNTLVLLYVL